MNHLRQFRRVQSPEVPGTISPPSFLWGYKTGGDQHYILLRWIRLPTWSPGVVCSATPLCATRGVTGSHVSEAQGEREEMSLKL